MTEVFLGGFAIGAVVAILFSGIYGIICDYLKGKEDQRQHEMSILIKAVDRLEVDVASLRIRVDCLEENRNERR